jgi:hypothetical protein
MGLFQRICDVDTLIMFDKSLWMDILLQFLVITFLLGGGVICIILIIKHIRK